jgi:hypothetical protein
MATFAWRSIVPAVYFWLSEQQNDYFLYNAAYKIQHRSVSGMLARIKLVL